MKKKILWLVVSCLMVAALVLASCGPAEEEEEEVAPPPTEEEEEVAPPEEEEETIPPPSGEPRYGGMLTLCLSAPVIQMDETSGQSHELMPLNNFTFDTLTRAPWEQGPAGTGETSLMYNVCIPIPRFIKGALAESWEFPDPETIIVHLRQGVRFHNKPPVNGRELVADDVVYSVNRDYWDIAKSYNHNAFTDDQKPQSMKALDKYTVEIKCVPGMAGAVMLGTYMWIRIIPREIIDQYGDMEDWTRLIGTGPFIINDYVASSSATFIRNPNYWEKDPVSPGKGNQLPYIDSVKLLIIEDTSTRMSALRTARIDHLNGVEWEQGEHLLTQRPELQSIQTLQMSSLVSDIWMRTDVEPLKDIRVRRALSLAVDQREILKELYGSKGILLSMPILPIKEYEDLYVDLKELPETTRELFDYNPEKARQLLAEAGYPDGFKTEVLAYSSAQSDVLSIVKYYWDAIGVDMEIDLKEYGVFVSAAVTKKYPQMVMAWGISVNPFRFHNFRTGAIYNFAKVDDARIMELYNSIAQPRTDAEWKDLVTKVQPIVPYMIDQCYSVPLPRPYYYTIWWPWLQGYHGEFAPIYHYVATWAQYVWIDQDMKEEITGK